MEKEKELPSWLLQDIRDGICYSIEEWEKIQGRKLRSKYKEYRTQKYIEYMQGLQPYAEWVKAQYMHEPIGKLEKPRSFSRR